MSRTQIQKTFAPGPAAATVCFTPPGTKYGDTWRRLGGEGGDAPLAWQVAANEPNALDG